jgi:hypothetical protein
MRFFIAALVVVTAALSACAPTIHTFYEQDSPPVEAQDNGSTVEIGLAETEPQALIKQEESYEELQEDFTISPELLFDIMDSAREKFGEILDDSEKYEVQILLTQIDSNRSGQPVFTCTEYGADATKYFYPASTVKMTIAALALQKINVLAGADRYCVLNVAKSKNGAVGGNGFTIEKYIHSMIVYSDNIAYNRLYDFLGQEYINETLHEMGYVDCQIVRRFDSITSATADRVNYPWELRDGEGALIASQTAVVNENIFTLRGREDMTGLLRGNAHVSGKSKFAGPKEFYDYNYMSVAVLQQILKALIFPLEVPEHARFNIAKEDREFLLDCMRENTGENKYFIYGGTDENYSFLDIYNKTGTSYGNIIDNAYIKDRLNCIEFMLTAVIYVNSNGVIGDEIYEYEKTGMPFLKNLSLAVYNYYLEKRYNGKMWL